MNPTYKLDDLQHYDNMMGYDLIINRLDMIFFTLLIIVAIQLFNTIRRAKNDSHR